VVFGRAINWFFDLIWPVRQGMAIAQLPGPHPSDRACRLCGAVGADGLAFIRTTGSSNEDQGYFISIIQAPEGFAELHQRYAWVETEPEAAGNASNFCDWWL